MIELFQFWFEFMQEWGYLGIIVLMAMESSIFPVPSELVIPPAAYIAVTHGDMSLSGVIVAGTLGSYLGAIITYAVSRCVGRPIVLRWGKYFFVSPKKLESAEKWLENYELSGIFFARLLPVVRHLISIPAGIVRMPVLSFSLMTIIGSAIWCTVLAFFGKKAITPEMMEAKSVGALVNAVKEQSFWIVVAIGVFCALYFLMKYFSLRSKKEKIEENKNV